MCNRCSSRRLEQLNKQHAREQAARDRSERRSGAGRIAGAVVTGAMTVTGVYGEPQQSSTETMNNWGETRQQDQSDRRSREIDGATRDQGERNRGSGQSS